jgi:Flp pilus assembly protein TadG
MEARLLAPLKRLRTEESGQSLVILIVAMVAMLGVAALAIDVGSWYQKRHEAQVVADAAALAAANCLANPNSGQNSAAVPQCVSSTDTTDAQKVAVAYAASNGLTIDPSKDVAFSGDTVTVTATNTSPTFFANLFGIGSATERASATASYTTATSGGCANPGVNCYAIFTKDSSPSSVGFSLTGGGFHINGGIRSNCNLSLGGGGSQFGPTTYGSASGCSAGSGGGGNSYTSGPTAQAATNTWPIDYSTYFPACSGAACTGPNGTPSFCTASAPNYNFTTGSQFGTGGIFCAYGTGTPGTPSTWNGAISFNSGGYSSTNASFIGGTISQNSGVISLTAYDYVSGASKNYPLFYATSSSSSAINLVGGGTTYLGDMFVPNGGVSMTGGGTLTTFIEAQDVSWKNGGVTGDGPLDTGTGATTTGSDSLTN